MSEQDLSEALRERGAVKALLGIKESKRAEWLTKNNGFDCYQSYTTQELKNKEAQLSTEIHDLRAQGKFNLSIIYYFLY